MFTISAENTDDQIMSEKNLKVGQKVEIVGKNVTGEIAFVGMTTFATGKWVGVILNEPVGKNNGSLKGTVYFTVRTLLIRTYKISSRRNVTNCCCLVCRELWYVCSTDSIGGVRRCW